MGGALGLAILSTVATTAHRRRHARGGRRPQRAGTALTEGFQNAFLVGAAFAVAGIVLALVLLRGNRAEAQREALAEEPLLEAA